MPKSFEHFILTRFNLEKSDWKTNKNSREVLNAEWLENRIELFKRFCLPSVLGQSNKNFKWLLYFQSDPGDKVRDLIKELEGYTFIKPLFFDGFKDFQQNSATRITDILEADTNWILTSRLDNDDALNRFFVENLQNAVDDIDKNSLVYFPKGLFLDLTEPKKLGALDYPYNQFLSLLEPVDPQTEIRTVLDRAHDDWKDFPVKELGDPDAWLQIVHEENMVNTFKGYPVYSKRLGDFDLAKIRFDSFYNFRLFIKGLKRRIKSFLPNFSSAANGDKENRYNS